MFFPPLYRLLYIYASYCTYVRIEQVAFRKVISGSWGKACDCRDGRLLNYALVISWKQNADIMLCSTAYNAALFGL